MPNKKTEPTSKTQEKTDNIRS